MQPPKTQKAYVLYKLIKSRGASEQATGFNGFRTRISELKKLITINTDRRAFTNRFGRKSFYNFHFIAPENKPAAIELYQKINL